MARMLVSILSKHTMPNYLFIKEMEGRYDGMIFITTEQVDSSFGGEQLEEALDLSIDDVGPKYVSVDSDDYLKTIRGLREKVETKPGDTFIVNLTGGTKMMSLAVHDFFASHGTEGNAEWSAEFYYVPIGKNQYYNLQTGEMTPITYRVSLREYFCLYDIRYECTQESNFLHSQQETFTLFEEVRQNRYRLTQPLRNAQQAATPELRRYYGGEWFEQFAYFKLKEAFQLNANAIATSVKIYRQNAQDPTNDNELDVAFTYNNQLYVVECKVGMRGWNGVDPRDVVEEFLYKLAAISKDFGLVVKSYLFTLHDMRSFSENTRRNISKRCSILGIQGIVHRGMFTDLRGSLSNRQALLLQ